MKAPHRGARARAQMLVAAIAESEAKLEKAGRVLHDDVGQVLSAVGLQLDVLRLDLQDQVPEIAPRTAEIQKLLEDVMVRIRELSHELNPSVVERTGLLNALEQLAQSQQTRFPGTVLVKLDPALLVPRRAARALYKVAECALENAVRHSGAPFVEIAAGAISGRFFLEVTDNGKGFDLQKAKLGTAGAGLLLMECYAAGGGLSLAIETAPGRGTIVRASQAASETPLQEERR